jgi:hypothetical protein
MGTSWSGKLCLLCRLILVRKLIGGPDIHVDVHTGATSPAGWNAVRDGQWSSGARSPVTATVTVTVAVTVTRSSSGGG